MRSSQPEAEAMLRTELKQLDPNVALTDVRTLARQVEMPAKRRALRRRLPSALPGVA